MNKEPAKQTKVTLELTFEDAIWHSSALCALARDMTKGSPLREKLFSLGAAVLGSVAAQGVREDLQNILKDG